MNSGIAAAPSDVFSPTFWQQLSGPEEERALKLTSYGLVASILASMLASLYLGLPYGRYASRSFGPPVPARLAWAVQEAPSFFVPLALILFSGGERLHARPNLVLLSLFLAHYAQRAFIFPFLIRGGKPTPAFPFLLAFIYCTCNGYLQGRSLSNYAKYPSDWLTDPRFILGVIGWLSGLLINLHSDYILRNLRKPGETGYKIPRGGLFEYVTGANFFGEIVEWVGFALAGCTVESASFAICTALVLSRRAYMHHCWYHTKFEDYPKSRKVLIPFIF